MPNWGGRVSEGKPVDIAEIEREDLPILQQLDRLSDLPQWSLQDYQEFWSESHSLILVAGRVPCPVGFVCGRSVAREAEILKLVVIETHRRRGVGRRLVRQFLFRVGKNGCQSVYLDVRESNAAAIHLYDSCGFRVVGRREGYYRDTREDALLMAKHTL
jgi:ribosomal-protein-alanine N-acetyltransferase